MNEMKKSCGFVVICGVALALAFTPIVHGKHEPDIAHEQNDTRSAKIETTRPINQATANTDTTCLPSYYSLVGGLNWKDALKVT